MIQHKMTSSMGVFAVLAKNLHPFGFWVQNTVTSAKKSLTLFVVAIIIPFLGGTLLVDHFKEDRSDDPEGVFSGFKSKITLIPYSFFYSLTFLVVYEVLKNLLIKIPKEDGTAELNEVPSSNLSVDKKSNQKEESKVSPTDFEEKNGPKRKNNLGDAEKGGNTERVATNPGSTNRDDISTGRQFQNIVGINNKGTRNKEIIDVTAQLEGEDQEKNPDLEIILEAEPFEEKTRYTKIRVILALVLISILLVFTLYVCTLGLKKVNINALFRSIGF